MKKKLFQINTVANSGSTGHIAEDLGRLVMNEGWDSFIAYGRWACPSQSHLIKIGDKLDIIVHGAKSLLFDRHGLGSESATLELITKIEKIKPDIIHLHNIHGYYLNYRVLFSFLSKSNVPVVWTLHDCWSMTGHCVHFQNFGCSKWMSHCYDCPSKKDYPRRLCIDNSSSNYFLKKHAFTSVPNMTIVPVCSWLGSLLKQSFLSSISCQVIVNGIDLDTFKPLENNGELRKKWNIDSDFVILAVATGWNSTKGYNDILKLSSMISEKDVIVIVGVTKQQKRRLPPNIIGIEKTENIDQLVELYSLADIFINPTYQDTLPTVNMEALACGTPVITYDTGGSCEIVSGQVGNVIERGDLYSMLLSVNDIKKNGKQVYVTLCRARARTFFDKNKRYKEYLSLYNSLVTTSF